ncbi:MAG: hypothetical protein JSU58_01970 [Dehalococcoidales bacterium]|nr:MAG: hypothetical protein JSU58_01970 [Dehalococcoidales bacterium]
MDFRATESLKNRIGEAIVETTLVNFGYTVERINQVQKTGTTEQVSTPDLLVTDPKNNSQIYLEVKLRSQEPMKIRIEKAQVDYLKINYPDALLVFVSAFNSSINCLEVIDPVLNDDNLNEEGCYELKLLANEWKPLWNYFPLVQKGDKTDALWYSLKDVLDDFAANRITHNKDNEFFAEEKESLKAYVQKHWHPGMMDHNIHMIDPDITDITDVWEHALAIHAFRFAFEMCGNENIDHPAFSQVMEKVLGRTGEKFITIPYQDIKKALTEHPELYKQLQELEEKVSNTPPYDAGVVMMEGLLEIIPPGIGSAYVLPEKDSDQDILEVDFYTVLRLLQRRNCLYD